MRSVFGMCLDWKVIVVLGLAMIGPAVLAPGVALAALPLLLFAICPLSMLLMLLMMRRGGPHESDTPASSPGPVQLVPVVVPIEEDR